MKLKLILLMVITLSMISCGGSDKSKKEAPEAVKQEEKSEVSSADPMLNKIWRKIKNQVPRDSVLVHDYE